MSSGSRLILIKLGGSLITDKTATELVRMEVLERLAIDLRDLLEERRVSIVLGHGSGSFGHAAAVNGGWARSGGGPELGTLARTQDAAARLHRHVIAVLLEAGLAPFSLAPGSMMTSVSGRVAEHTFEPLLAALEEGLLPVTFGDVVLDHRARARIFSTERVFLSIVPALLARGYAIESACWLGSTDGILDSGGEPIGEIGSDRGESVLSTLADGDAGQGVRDVTGGMRHRLESVLALSRLGVPSWILDGREAGVLGRALRGEPVSGTFVRVGR